MKCQEMISTLAKYSDLQSTISCSEYELLNDYLLSSECSISVDLAGFRNAFKWSLGGSGSAFKLNYAAPDYPVHFQENGVEYDVLLQEADEQYQRSRTGWHSTPDHWTTAYEQDMTAIRVLLSPNCKTKLNMSEVGGRCAAYVYLGDAGGTDELYTDVWCKHFDKDATSCPMFQIFIKINDRGERRVLLRGKTSAVTLLRDEDPNYAVKFKEMINILACDSRLGTAISCAEYKLLRSYIKTKGCSVTVNLHEFRYNFINQLKCSSSAAT
jgi:hypothetical protein